MANMFKTLEAEGGSRGPEWLSSHPNPGNRYNAIMNEARSLRVQGNANTGDFQSIQARLNGMSPAYTAEQIAKGQARSGTQTVSRRAPINVEPPAPQYRNTRPLNFLRLSVPSNWSEVSGSDNGATYAPNGGYVEEQDNSAFTHGLQVGVTPTRGSGNLQRDTEQLIASFARTNSQLRSQGSAVRDQIAGRAAIRTNLSNVSEVTGQRESVSLTTTQLADGRVLFIIGVSPQSEAGAYEDAFRRVRQSVELSDR
jgi:hypothetical protein